MKTDYVKAATLLSAANNKDLYLAHVKKRLVETVAPKPKPRLETSTVGTQTSDDLLVTPEMMARASAAAAAAAVAAVVAAGTPGPAAMEVGE